MNTLFLPNPPQAVDGHPIRIHMIDLDQTGKKHLVTIGITTPSGEQVRSDICYDDENGVTIDAIPKDQEAYRLLLAALGPTPWVSNPLSDAIKAVTGG